MTVEEKKLEAARLYVKALLHPEERKTDTKASGMRPLAQKKPSPESGVTHLSFYLRKVL